jgi:hypothetical protein
MKKRKKALPDLHSELRYFGTGFAKRTANIAL